MAAIGHEKILTRNFEDGSGEPVYEICGSIREKRDQSNMGADGHVFLGNFKLGPCETV